MRLRYLPREIILALLFLVGSCFIKLDGQAMNDTVPILRIVKPDVADSAWRYDSACAGDVPKMPLDSVRWFVADLEAHSPKHDLIGYWQPPDSIILDIRFTQDFETIAHELEHFRRQQGGHPDDPFLRCELGGLTRPPK